MTNLKILVTGAGGFIGSHVSRILKNEKVIGLEVLMLNILNF